MLDRLCIELTDDEIKHKHYETTLAVENHIPDLTGSKITHEWLWPRIGSWLKKGDIVVTETGTSNFGILDTKLPEGVETISQVLWGSIGWSCPASVGVALAVRDFDEKKQVILFIGDGSLELTIQEISTVVRYNLPVIVFVINNSGYTIEKLIHGLNAGYNAINTQWKYTDIPSFFGSDSSKSFQIATAEDLDSLLDSKEIQTPCFRLVELIMDPLDAPRALKVQSKLTEEINATT